MKFNCEIDNVKTLKKGMKITLAIDDSQTIEVMKNIYNFMDKPVTVELLIDAAKQLEKMKWITNEQRSKIFALVNDIAEYTVEDKEYIRQQTKQSFLQATEYEDFSLSNCSKELASDYIDFLLRLAFELGVPLSQNPIEGLDDIESYLRICIEKKKCCICGKSPSDLHHWDAIGMGNDRKTFDDSLKRKIQLCREHHSEAHNIGRDTFGAKYHVYGIIYED